MEEKRPPGGRQPRGSSSAARCRAGSAGPAAGAPRARPEPAARPSRSPAPAAACRWARPSCRNRSRKAAHLPCRLPPAPCFRGTARRVKRALPARRGQVRRAAASPAPPRGAASALGAGRGGRGVGGARCGACLRRTEKRGRRQLLLRATLGRCRPCFPAASARLSQAWFSCRPKFVRGQRPSGIPPWPHPLALMPRLDIWLPFLLLRDTHAASWEAVA